MPDRSAMTPDCVQPAHVRLALSDSKRLHVLEATGLMHSRQRDRQFDRWAKLTAQALGAPVAVVSVLDADRQFFKSSFGLAGWTVDEPGILAARTLCQNVVADGEPVAVEDARSRPGPVDAAAIERLDVVTNAGAAIVVAGQRLGALCVIGSEPRRWDQRELKLLVGLAEGLAYELELRVATFELARGAALTEAHNRIHEQIVADQPLRQILAAIVASVEEHDPTLIGSILLLDQVARTLHLASAPRLPQEFLTAIEGMRIGPSFGSCGAAAASGEEVCSHDIGQDRRWDGYRDAAARSGLRHCWSFPIVRSDGTVLGTFGFYGDAPRSPTDDERRLLGDAAKLAAIAIERRQSYDQPVFDATHDGPTGLLNRSTVCDRLDELLRVSHDVRGPISLLLVDLDRLKSINDSLGHATGDHVIQQTARRLQESATPDDLVARIAGEEFLIVTVGDESHAAALAQRFLEVLRAPLAGIPDRHDLAITGSIGITVISDQGIDARHAIRRADAATTAAQFRGGNQCAFGDRADSAVVTRRLVIENALRHAIDQRELSVVYQPLQRFSDGCPTAVEALVRWTHPVLGAVGPDEFIPVAEQTGLIKAIGTWVLDTACAASRDLDAEYGREMHLSVNVSAQQLRDPSLPATIAAALRRNDLTVDRIYVELTETALLTSDEVTEQTVDALDTMGVGIALDDFGTGYSSLAVLKRYPVAGIKIDRSFIAGLPEDQDDLAIVTALIGMAHNLGLATVAEGIETARQYRLLRELGCQYAQGYLTGRPAPARARARA